MEKDTRSMSLSLNPALSSASFMTRATTSAWWLAASLGWSPPSFGLNMSTSLAYTLRSESTMPTPKVWAVPSIPRVIIATGTLSDG